VLNPQTLPAVQAAIRDLKLDGWLLFDFHGLNPVATGLLGLEGLLSRRIFALIPAQGPPVAITHAIEQAPWKRWPSEWRKETYSSWRSLEEHLAALVKGRKVAMEYSPGDAVPYLDRVPAGVLEMVRQAGGKVVSSGELVTRFYAAWTAAHVDSHRRSAAAIAQVARDAFTVAGKRARGGAPMAEHELDPRSLRRALALLRPRSDCRGRSWRREPALRDFVRYPTRHPARRHPSDRPVGQGTDARWRLRRPDLDGLTGPAIGARSERLDRRS
jgi:Xaa-Pro dipeptidase